MPGATSASPSTGLTFFPGGDRLLYALRCRAPTFRNALNGLSPPLQFRRRHNDLDVRIKLLVGVFRHQAPNVVTMKVRDDDFLNCLRVEACGFHVLGENAGFRPPGLTAAGPSINEDDVIAFLHCDDGEGDRHKSVGQLRCGKRSLGLGRGCSASLANLRPARVRGFVCENYRSENRVGSSLADFIAISFSPSPLRIDLISYHGWNSNVPARAA